MKKAFVLGVASCAVAFGLLSPPASASQAAYDDFDFMTALGASGYEYGSQKDAVGFAKFVCGEIKKAKTPAAKRRAAKAFYTANQVSRAWPSGKLAGFMAVATLVYCPSQKKYLPY